MTDAPVRFWTNVRKRIIVVSEMDREIRLTFIAGVAVVAVAIFLNLFSLLGGPGVETLVGHIPLLTLLFLSLGEMIVAFLLFSGVARLSGWPRYAALVALALPLLGLFLLNGTFAGIGLLLPLPVLAVVAWLADKQAWPARRRTLAVAALSLLSLLIAALYLAAGQEALIISVVGLQGMFAMFGLFMAATDIAELTEIGAEAFGFRIFEYAKSTRVRMAIALAVIFADIIVAVVLIVGASPSALGEAVGGGLDVALLLGLTLWLLVSSARHLEAVEPHITYGSLLVLVGATFLAFEGALLWRLMLDPASYDAKESFSYVQIADAFLLVFLASLASLLTLGRRSPTLFAASALGVVIGVLGFAHYLYHGNDVAYVGFAIAIGSILLMTAGRFVRVVRANYSALCVLIAELNLSAIAYSFLLWLFFPVNGDKEAFGFWQAAFVLLALGWDIISSGPITTSQDSKRFPRFTRVCLFFAYIISVALLVMLGRSAELLDPISHAPASFDSEALVAVGLALFGVPFYVFVFALRVRAAVFAGPKRDDRARGAPPGTGPEHATPTADAV